MPRGMTSTRIGEGRSVCLKSVTWNVCFLLAHGVHQLSAPAAEFFYFYLSSIYATESYMSSWHANATYNSVMRYRKNNGINGELNVSGMGNGMEEW